MADVQQLVDDLAFELGRCVRTLASTRQIVAESIAFLNTTTPTTPPIVAPISMASLGSLMLADRPMSYWDMQGSVGSSVVQDRGTASAALALKGSGWTSDAPIMRTAPYGIGRITYADELGGAYATASGSYDLGAGFSFEAWVSPRNWNWMQTILQLSASGAPKLTLEHINNDGWYVNSVKLGDVTLNPETLHHLALTVTATGVATLFWDGAKVGGATIPKLSGVATAVQINGGFPSRPSLSTPYAHVALYGTALADAAVKARWDAGNGTAPMPTRGSYHLGSVTPSQMFASQARAKTFWGRDDKFATSTWWGGCSSVEEVQAEKAAGSKAMVVITPNEQASWYEQAGVYMVPTINPPSDRWTVDHVANAGVYSSANTVAHITEDEVSLAGTVQEAVAYLSADIQKVGADVAAWSNHGFDMFWRPRDDMAKILNVKAPNGRQMQIQGADYYTHSTDKRIRAEFGQKIGVFPSGTEADDAKARAMADQIRHCWASYENVRTLRAAYDHPVLHQAFIGLGHANAITGGMPTGREVRGDFWASVIGGAQCVSWFYHSFSDCPGWWNGLNAARSSRLVYSYKESSGTVRYWRPKVEKTDSTLPPPSNSAQWEQVSGMYLEWDATYAHQQDDTVMRSGKYWTAVGKPRLGVAPELDKYNDATDTGAWVSWAFQAQGLRALSVSATPGMGSWVKKSTAEADKLAPLIHRNSAALALSDRKLIWRYWPNTEKTVLTGDSKAYAYVAVMQGFNQWSGTYTVNVPAGVTSVEVLTEVNGSGVAQAVVNGKVSLNFAKEYDVRFIRWAVDGSAPTQPILTFTRSLVAHIGDSLTEQPGEQMVANAYKAAPASFENVSWYGKYGHFIMPAANPADPDTVQIIRDLRAKGEPDVWVIALGTNMSGEPSTAEMAAQVDQVLAEIDKAGPRPVMWINVATKWSYPHAFHQAVNQMLLQKMTARGKYGYLADWWSYVKTECMDKGLENVWFPDGTHMDDQTYPIRYAFASRELNNFVTTKLEG